MSEWFQCTVKYEKTMENGQQKKVTEPYLVDAISFTEAERRIIEEITAEPEIGRIYDAKVVKITDFGAFVAFLPGKEGLVHVSQIAEHRVNNVEDELSVGQEVKVKLLEIDRQGRVRLSIKEAKNPL